MSRDNQTIYTRELIVDEIPGLVPTLAVLYAIPKDSVPATITVTWELDVDVPEYVGSDLFSTGSASVNAILIHGDGLDCRLFQRAMEDYSVPYARTRELLARYFHKYLEGPLLYSYRPYRIPSGAYQ